MIASWKKIVLVTILLMLSSTILWIHVTPTILKDTAIERQSLVQSNSTVIRIQDQTPSTPLESLEEGRKDVLYPLLDNTKSSTRPSSEPSQYPSDTPTSTPTYKPTIKPSNAPSTDPTEPSKVDWSDQPCPLPSDDSNITDLPQILRVGEHSSDSAYPYLSKDIWAELVDNQRTFFLRRYEEGFPNSTTLRQWIASRPHPITIVMNNYMDKSFPARDETREELLEWGEVLAEPNLHALYVDHLGHLEEEEEYIGWNKVQPLPRGLHWNFMSSWLYGDKKDRQYYFYRNISSSPSETQRLFEQNRTATVWVSYWFWTHEYAFVLME